MQKGHSVFHFLLVEKLTHSHYSHASIVLRDGGKTIVLEVNEKGTQVLALRDWERYCIDHSYAVYRVKGADESKLSNVINKFIARSPGYDFTFDDPNKFYCVESVVFIYQQTGIVLCQPILPCKVLPWWLFHFILPINWAIGMLTSEHMAMHTPLYFVGNEKQGLLSSSLLCKIEDVRIPLS